MIEWVAIEKSIIRRIGYDSALKSLFIDFKGSEIDIPFCNVPESVYLEFIETEFTYQFYKTHIKQNYHCEGFEKLAEISSKVSEI